jgi:deoxyribodipyrimidine photolyase-related protein
LFPIDNLIEKVRKYAFWHHNERLMFIGNYFVICQVKPQDVYEMFMEWTIDAYEWVMVANIYGMSQYSNNMMSTRPYFSSSNYLKKMSNYKYDDKWEVIWNSLYYYFIYKNKEMLSKNYAYYTQVIHWDNKSYKEKKELIRNAKKYI